jgi:hypothetical protein
MNFCTLLNKKKLLINNYTKKNRRKEATYLDLIKV